MKKNNYSVLAVLVLVTLFTLVSCQKDEDGKVLFRATIESPTQQGKTAITSVGVMTWLDGDRIAVYDGKTSSTPCILSATPTGDGKTADFVPVLGEEPKNGAYFAIYPADIAEGYNTVSLPSEYSYNDSRFDAPMYAYSTDDQLMFKNLCSVVQFNLTASKAISSIVIATDLPITGKFVLDYNEGRPTMEAVDGYTGNLLTINLGSAGANCTNTNGHSYYVYLPLGNYHEMSFTFNAIDGSYCTKSLQGDDPFYVTRNSLNPLDFVLTFPDRPNGSKGGLFTIDTKGTQVWFAKGNLQYQASSTPTTHTVAGGGTAQGMWRFAEHQWDYVGDATYGNVFVGNVKSNNANIKNDYSGWIDLFAWGTSGWNSGAVCYQPWSTSTTLENYYPGGSDANDLTGDYANADWAWYNAISNGGNTAQQWRTLSSEEWIHLVRGRTNANLKRATGNINGVGGLILLPDDWTLPTGCTFNPGSSSSDWTHNSYSLAQWAAMEDAGAVFLPAAGVRAVRTVNNASINGYYWSTSHWNVYNATNVWFFSFESDKDWWTVPENRSSRNSGFSVRPVCVKVND